MPIVGRSVELAEASAVLDSAASGAGALLSLLASAGSGKTAVLTEIVGLARRRGFDVIGVSARADQDHSGVRLWSDSLRAAAVSEPPVGAVSGISERAERAVTALLTDDLPRLIVIDDVDQSGPHTRRLLRSLASRVMFHSTAIIVTTGSALGFGRELRLGPLTEAQFAQILDGAGPADVRAVWLAGRGLPGHARRLYGQLGDSPVGRHPLVQLALAATPSADFLNIDQHVARLLEMALDVECSDDDRARLLARLSRQLLGDPLSGLRRRALSDQALLLAGRGSPPSTMAEVLDARLHALWDAAGTTDRLTAAEKIIALARSAGDTRRERDGLFWRFVALMELAHVDEAVQVLMAFERSAEADADAEAEVMALSRHAMLATLWGRFPTALALADEVVEKVAAIMLPDRDRLVAALRGAVLAEQDDPLGADLAATQIAHIARRLPGHLFESTAIRIWATGDRRSHASVELARLLPTALASSGPRWLGAVTDLAAAIVMLRDLDAAPRVYEALLPYRGRLVMWGGANSCTGPVCYYLGILAQLLGNTDAATGHLREAAALTERIGALPALAHALIALARTVQGSDPAAAAVLQHRALHLARSLGMTRLLAELPEPAEVWSLLRQADGWALTTDTEHVHLMDRQGIGQLRILLAAPHRDISALDLAAGGPGLAAATVDKTLDATAIATYRRRLTELDAELDEADGSGDQDRAVRADTERQALLTEIRRATGLGGRIRETNSAAERARVNVTRTLRQAIGFIQAAAPRTGAHLQASIRTGLTCRYEPAAGGPSRWSL